MVRTTKPDSHGIRRRWRLGIALALVVLLLPPAWNLAATTWAHRQNPVPGAFYTVVGYRMHIHCSGSGAPTVVLEAAATASWMAWRRVQPELSRDTRVCSYDRAGHGWSDLRPGPRDADRIVTELHELLDSARVDRPIVLVGHSAGGLYARAYARRFPGEVAGVALLDASSPRQLAVLPGWRASYEQTLREHPARMRREKLRVWSGWERLTGGCGIDDSDEPPEITGQYAAMLCRPAFVGGEENEYPYFESASQQAGRLTSLGTVPLLIISRDPAAEADPSPQTQAQESAWNEEQEKARTLSQRSWRIVARGAGHAVHHARVELVVGELRRLVEYVRGGPAPPFGTTTIQ